MVFVLKITDLLGFECKNQLGFWRKLKRTNFYLKGLWIWVILEEKVKKR